jgi:hypothetical protein
VALLFTIVLKRVKSLLIISRQQILEMPLSDQQDKSVCVGLEVLARVSVPIFRVDEWAGQEPTRKQVSGRASGSCVIYYSALKTVTCSSETSYDFQWTTRNYVPEYRTLQDKCDSSLRLQMACLTSEHNLYLKSEADSKPIRRLDLAIWSSDWQFWIRSFSRERITNSLIYVMWI